MFRLERGNVFSNSIVPCWTTDYIRTHYEDVRKMMESHGHERLRGEKGNEFVESFVGFAQFFFNQTAAILKNTALVVYLDNAFL